MKPLSQRLNSVIPGGAHTYSKGHDQFPENAPSLIEFGEGAWVFDENGNKFVDCAMGLTSVSLGHGDKEVAKAVYESALRGTNYSKPAAMELKAAEYFLAQVVPHHDMVKFTKNGSTATTAALKLARAYTGREKVLVPKEFPFFSYDDWFIAGTSTNHGTQKAAREQILKFEYGNIASLESILEEHSRDIAALIMEPVKFKLPYDGYLSDLGDLCKRFGVVFVLDEMWCGARLAVGGGQEYFNVEADLATWGKGIANGFSCCALTGKREIMDLGGILNKGSKKLFLVSTTHGAESTSLAAMMTTIDRLKNTDILAENYEIGDLFFKKCGELINKYGLAQYIRIVGDTRVVQTLEICANDKFDTAQLATFLYQELVREGVLYNGLFYFMASHRDREVECILSALDKAFSKISDSVTLGTPLNLIGDTVKPVFREVV